MVKKWGQERKRGQSPFLGLPLEDKRWLTPFTGLLREFFPKGTFFATITQKDVDRAVRLINSRPRKRLGYLTPHEVFKRGGAIQVRI